MGYVPTAASSSEKAAMATSVASVEYVPTEASSSSGWVTSWRSIWMSRECHGAMLGVLQGFCCPAGLMGLGFMGRVAISTSTGLLTAFAFIFVLASGVGSGAITAGWGFLSSNGLSGCCSPRTMYMLSSAA